jgi:hypothetical protein
MIAVSALAYSTIFSACFVAVDGPLSLQEYSGIPTPKNHFGRKDFLPVKPRGGLSFLFRLSELKFA